MPYFAIRNVFLFGRKPEGVNVYEERIVGFHAATWDEAHAKAADEAKRYAAASELEVHGDQEGYEQDDPEPGETIGDGRELWSVLYESTASIEEFYRERYDRSQYIPPPV